VQNRRTLNSACVRVCACVRACVNGGARPLLQPSYVHVGTPSVYSPILGDRLVRKVLHLGVCVCVSLSLSPCPSVCLSLSLSLFLSIYLYLYLVSALRACFSRASSPHASGTLLRPARTIDVTSRPLSCWRYRGHASRREELVGRAQERSIAEASVCTYVRQSACRQ